MAKNPKRATSSRLILSIGVAINRVVVEFPPVGRRGKMRVYGRSAGLTEGEQPLSEVYIEDDLPQEVLEAIQAAVSRHAMPRLEEAMQAKRAGQAEAVDNGS